MDTARTDTTGRDSLLYLKEVAERLRRSESQLRFMVKAGTAPKSARIGGRIVFRESDVERFIEDAFAEVP